MNHGSRDKAPTETNRRHLQTASAGPDKLGLVESSIVEIEGPPKSCDVTRWAQIAFLASDKARWIGASIPVERRLEAITNTVRSRNGD